MSLHLISLRPDFQRLMALAARERLLPPGGDLGYALHAVFAASFGELEPKPFRLLLPGDAGGGPSGRLLAYCAAPLHDLTAHAAAFADPAFANVLALADAEDKAMPTDFAPGTRLGFSVRIRPIQRTGAARDGSARAQERDAFSPSQQLDGESGPAARARVYASWLTARLARDGAATAESCSVTALSRTVLFARDRSAATKRNRSIDGPDATVTGVLRVTDSAAFAALLTRGIGRFRSFGFGMLLLRPPG